MVSVVAGVVYSYSYYYLIESESAGRLHILTPPLAYAYDCSSQDLLS